MTFGGVELLQSWACGGLQYYGKTSHHFHSFRGRFYDILSPRLADVKGAHQICDAHRYELGRSGAGILSSYSGSKKPNADIINQVLAEEKSEEGKKKKKKTLNKHAHKYGYDGYCI